MKKLIIILVAISIWACNEKTNNPYVTLEGNVNNGTLDSIMILGKGFQKVLKVNEDGSFKDTLKVTDGFHGITDGKQQSFLYLKNGYDMRVDIDMMKFPEAVSYEGYGSETNNYLSNKIQFIQDEKLTNYALYFELEKEEFDSKVAELKAKLDGLLENAEGLEEEVVKMEVEANGKLIAFFETNYEKEHLNYAGLKKGDPSPKFVYPNQFGENVALDDFKGKYVYIDVWATWCGPCKKEIPYLKDLDEAYKGKDIAFVSLSIDKMEHKDKWLKMIEEEDLKGVQILADNEWRSEFVSAYNITGIPRFILIDQEGNILNSNAPRPSDPYLKEVLGSLEL